MKKKEMIEYVAQAIQKIDRFYEMIEEEGCPKGDLKQQIWSVESDLNWIIRGYTYQQTKKSKKNQKDETE